MFGNLKFFFFLFVLSRFTFSLYEHQAGVFDWSIRNIGEIDTVRFSDNNFYFTIKDDTNSIGSAQYLNGIFLKKYCFLIFFKRKHSIFERIAWKNLE